MTHTYNTLNDNLVRQYAYIWSFERLQKAEDNLNEHQWELKDKIRRKEKSMKEGEYYQIYNSDAVTEVLKMTEELDKTIKWLRIIRLELVKRQTPNMTNVAYGIYGRFDSRKGSRDRWDARWNI